MGTVDSTSIDSVSINILPFQKIGNILHKGDKIVINMIRLGDAHYAVESVLDKIDKRIITVVDFFDLKRVKEYRHPYVDAMIRGKIVRNKPIYDEDKIELPLIVVKINEFETIIRLKSSLELHHNYFLTFKIDDFTVGIVTQIIGKKSLTEESLYYYTMKYVEMSDIAEKMLKKYIYDHT